MVVEDDGSWRPWVVDPESGFEVRDGGGRVGLVQIDRTNFLVTKEFRFRDERVTGSLVRHMVADGVSAEEARIAVDDARRFTPTEENPTDLASIPRFMRWFESPYGTHTLAAILHDELIREEPNSGALHSDTRADWFFREMLRETGMPWLKRWIMWAAVALRTRWAAGGARKASVLGWIVLAVLGIAAFVWAVGVGLGDWPEPLPAVALLGLALVLPFVAGAFWGKQYGASLIAAVAALWVLPAVVFVGLGYGVYRALEWGASHIGLD